MPLQLPTKTIRSSSDIYNDPNTSEKFTSQDIFSGVTSHQFQFQNSATSPFSQLIRTQRKKTKYDPFTDYINRVQKNPICNKPTQQIKLSNIYADYNNYNCL